MSTRIIDIQVELLPEDVNSVIREAIPVLSALPHEGGPEFGQGVDRRPRR
jgi:hypothetical protein